MIPPSPFCVTTTPNCFKLAFPYHPRLVELVKRIPSVKQNIRAAYIADEKAWKVSLQDKEYVRMMADWAVQTRICSRVQHKVTTREYNDYTIPDLPKLTVPHGLLLEPYEYQKEGIAYALQHKRCIFGDQPGLGKTLQAIGTVKRSGPQQESNPLGAPTALMRMCAIARGGLSGMKTRN